MNFDRIIQSPTLVLGSFALAVLGVVLAVIFYYRGKREKSPRFLVTSRTLVEGLTGEIEGLKVLFQNQPQERIIVDRIHFGNAGRETIRREDLTAADPLRIACDEKITVLDARVLHTSASSIVFDLEKIQHDSERAIIPFVFDYLDHRDGAVLQ